MTRRIGLVALVVATMLAGHACRKYMPATHYFSPRQPGQANHSTADARGKFDHARHTKIFEGAGVTCGDCHRFDAKIDAGKPELAAALSGAGQYPGSGACHYCHGPSDTQMAAAPAACTTCHQNLAPLMPEDHEVAWDRVHATVAVADPSQCQLCHRDSFCINCHQARDSILTWVHERNFISYHSIEARANPMECGNCHREDFCLNCHAKAGVQ